MFRDYVGQQARFPEYDADRAMHQILASDFISLLNPTGRDWLLLGSLTLPTRPQIDPWPEDFHLPAVTGIHPAYVLPRTAFDLDLYSVVAAQAAGGPAQEVGLAYRTAVQAAIHRVAPARAPVQSAAPIGGVGLGGLVRYRTIDLRLTPAGGGYGVVAAQPVDLHYGAGSPRPTDDPITIELDIRAPGKMTDPAAHDVPQRPVVGIDVPGFQPVLPATYPLVDQLADKFALVTGPPFPGRGAPPGPWHRYKELFDLYYVLRTCRVDGAALQQAIARNWNWQRLPHDRLPVPYRLYGYPPLPAGEPEVPWAQGYERLRAASPQLRVYPSFAAVRDLVGSFADSLSAATKETRTWDPSRGWRSTRELNAADRASRMFRPPATSPREAPSATSQPPGTGRPRPPRTPPPPTQGPGRGP